MTPAQTAEALFALQGVMEDGPELQGATAWALQELAARLHGIPPQHKDRPALAKRIWTLHQNGIAWHVIGFCTGKSRDWARHIMISQVKEDSALLPGWEPGKPRLVWTQHPRNHLKWLRLLQSGLSPGEAALLASVHRQVLQKHVKAAFPKEYEAVKQKRGPKIQRPDFEKWRNLMKSEGSIRRAAKKAGVSKKTFRNYLIEDNPEAYRAITEENRRSTAPAGEWLRLLQKGLNPTRAARTAGVHTSTLISAVKREYPAEYQEAKKSWVRKKRRSPGLALRMMKQAAGWLAVLQQNPSLKAAAKAAGVNKRTFARRIQEFFPEEYEDLMKRSRA